MSDTKEKNKTLDDILKDCGISKSNQKENRLILWNDDVNSFEWVILCLVSLIGFTYEKAEKTAWNVHLKGLDVIKVGSKEQLLPYKKLLEERGLTVTIEE